MSEELDEIVDNLREPTSWFRILFMLAFAVVLYLIIAPVILVIMIAQALFAFVAGSPNSNLRDFSGALAEYIHQILKFLLYNSEGKPFPFSDFPEVDDAGDEGKSAGKGSQPSAKKSTAGKSTTKPAKKAAKKKSTAKKSKAESPSNGAGGESST